MRSTNNAVLRRAIVASNVVSCICTVVAVVLASSKTDVNFLSMLPLNTKSSSTRIVTQTCCDCQSTPPSISISPSDAPSEEQKPEFIYYPTQGDLKAFAIALNGSMIEFHGPKDQNGMPLQVTNLMIRPFSDDASSTVISVDFDAQGRLVALRDVLEGHTFQFEWVTPTSVGVTFFTDDGENGVVSVRVPAFDALFDGDFGNDHGDNSVDSGDTDFGHSDGHSPDQSVDSEDTGGTDFGQSVGHSPGQSVDSGYSDSTGSGHSYGTEENSVALGGSNRIRKLSEHLPSYHHSRRLVTSYPCEPEVPFDDFVTISVNKCGEPVTDANVQALVRYTRSSDGAVLSESYKLACAMGNGNYKVKVPSSSPGEDSSLSEQAKAQFCEQAGYLLTLTCASLDSINKPLELQICSQFAEAGDKLKKLGKFGSRFASLPLFVICESIFASMRLSCLILDNPTPFAPGIAGEICEGSLVLSSSSAVDDSSSIPTEIVYVTPRVIVNSKIYDGETKPGVGGTFNIDITEGGGALEELTVDPRFPTVGEPYVATATINLNCLPQNENAILRLSVERYGAENNIESSYSPDVTCVFFGAENTNLCSLALPAANEPLTSDIIFAELICSNSDTDCGSATASVVFTEEEISPSSEPVTSFSSFPTVLPSTLPSTLMPSTDPTTIPTDIIEAGDPCNGLNLLADNINVTTTAEALALSWIRNDPIALSPNVTRNQICQRYALAVFYHSVDGENSLLSDSRYVNWLSAEHECKWAYLGRSACNCQTIPNPCMVGVDVAWAPLQRLNFAWSKLNGTIPSSINFLSSLKWIDLQNNDLSGPLPTLSLPHLTILNLGDNELTGVLNLTNLACPNLIELHLERNELYGRLDAQDWSYFTRIEELFLSGNNFVGGISTFFELTTLTFLHLDRNNFAGSAFSPALFDMTNLISLNVGGNYNLRGSVPVQLCEMENLLRLSVEYTKIQFNDILLNWNATNTTNSSTSRDYNLELSVYESGVGGGYKIYKICGGDEF